MTTFKSYLYSLLITLFYSCSNTSNHSPNEMIVSNDSTNDSLTIKLPVDIPKISNISDYISDFHYVPLETTKKSLFGDCIRMEIYKERIYILDGIISPSVFIFDLNGKFIAKAGDQGNGPGELASATCMTIDPYNNYLIIGDTMQNKLVFYSLDGQFKKELFCMIAGMIDFGVIGKNCLGFANGEASNNPLPDNLVDCRIVTTDTLGNFTGGMLQQKDLATFCVRFPCFFRKDTTCYFSPVFTSDIYTVTDSTITKKYSSDYHFTPINIDPPENMNDFKESTRYMFLKTALCGLFVENSSAIAFQTKHNKQDFTTFYDKETQKSITVATHPYYTTKDSCLAAFNWLTAVDDYFVGYINIRDLRIWKDFCDKEGVKPYDPSLFTKSNEDDNILLVFFKLKKIL